MNKKTAAGLDVSHKTLQPPLSTLVKLGSIAVHADEMMSPTNHEFDRVALAQLLCDPEVVAWLVEMDKLGMVPRKRGHG